MSVGNDPVAFSRTEIDVFNRFESCRAHHIKAAVNRTGCSGFFVCCMSVPCCQYKRTLRSNAFQQLPKAFSVDTESAFVKGFSVGDL